LCGSRIGGVKLDLVKLRLTNKSDEDLQLTVQADLQGLSEPAIATVMIPSGSTKELGLTPTFKNVGTVTELTPSAIGVVVTGNRGRVYENTRRVKVLSRNDFFISPRLSHFLAVFVTPNDKAVDQLVSYAGEMAPDRMIAGYQRSKKEVYGEVAAIYQAIADLGVHYRSNTTSFLDGKSLGVQRITFPAESIEGTGANCIDGALLFASAFENAGLESCVVLVPTHAFVGVKLAKHAPETVFIETVLVGTQPFQSAVQQGFENIKRYQGKLRYIAVSNSRRLGITPFPYPLGTGDLPTERLRRRAGPTAPSGELVRLRPASGPPQPGAGSTSSCTTSRRTRYVYTSTSTQRARRDFSGSSGVAGGGTGSSSPVKEQGYPSGVTRWRVWQRWSGREVSMANSRGPNGRCALEQWQTLRVARKS